MSDLNTQIKEVLQEFVDLKAHKDKYGKDEHYQAAQPLAWNKARVLLSKANERDANESNCNKPIISNAKRTFCDGCMMPDGQNLGNMYICPKCGRSVD